MGFSGSESTECVWPDWPLGHAPLEKYETFGGRGDLVCSQCVIDEAVVAAVFSVDSESACGYCGGSVGPFAEDTVVFEYVYRCLGQEYVDPAYEALPPVDDEHQYTGRLDTKDVFDKEGCPFAEGSEVRQEFESRINHLWIRLGSFAGEFRERLLWGWDSFERRLSDGPNSLFSLSEAEMGEESAESLFDFLAEFAAEVGSGFVRISEPDLVLHRARAAEDVLVTAEDLGSPPPSLARSQRMSPAGVSWFYAAEDSATAKKEVPAKECEQHSVGRWATACSLTYADFVTEPELPSLYDFPRSSIRPYLFFLRDFIKRISRPADEDGADVYLATQRLAAYLRSDVPVADGYGIDAIRYPSAVHGGEANWVIFGRPDREDPPRIKMRPAAPTSEAPNKHVLA